MRKRTSRRRTPKKTTRADRKTAKAVRKGEHGRITPGNAKKLIGVAKVVGPFLAPLVIHAVAVLRERYERMRAHRLGVPVDQLGTFTGHGAALHARIAGDNDALRELSEQASGEAAIAAEQYAKQAAERLAQLSSAVRAAERMPAQRRKSAHRAVDAELGRIEEELLTRFGVRTARK